MKTRGLLYLVARLLGDVNAVKRNRVPRRVARRVVGKGVGRLMARVFR